MVGDSPISSVKDVIVKDITDKVKKKNSWFLLPRKGIIFNFRVENRLIKKQAFNLVKNSNVVELENTTLSQLFILRKMVL